MSGRHSHGGTRPGRTPKSVLAIVGVLLGVVIGAMAMLWPHDAPSLQRDNSTQQVNGVVDGIDRVACAADHALTSSAGGPDQACGTVRVILQSGNQRGSVVSVPLPSGVGVPQVDDGDLVVLAESAGNPEQSRYALIDHQRGKQLWVLFGAFLLAILAFGRLRGLSSLLGLGVTFLVVLAFIVPGILEGRPPVLVAIVGCAAIALIVLFLTHGLSRSTTVAVLGTLLSLVLTGLLSLAAVRMTKLTGSSDESSFLLGQNQGVDLRGLLLAGILIGSLGVLDDVTVTQAVTVEELAVANPTYGAAELYAAATEFVKVVEARVC